MRFLKALGLAAVAAMALMAFVNASIASAQDQITLCKALETLCAPGNLWPAKTVVTALAKNPELVTSIGTIKCEDSIVTALSETSVASPLKFDSPTVVFGVLPTPNLGLGCTGPCGSTGTDFIHAQLENLQVEVEATDKYFLKGSGLALILECPLVGTCVYRGENIRVPITHTGTHPSMTGNNLPLAKFVQTLSRQTTHGGSAFCPATSEWKADYVLVSAEDPSKNKGLAWPALDKP